MKASPWEIEDAQEEDIPIMNNMPPKEFVVENGTIGNLCGDIWEGVFVQKSDSITGGFVKITNAMFEHARVGITVEGETEVISVVVTGDGASHQFGILNYNLFHIK